MALRWITDTRMTSSTYLQCGLKMSANRYRKHFTPLESNPDVFTQLIHNLGVSSALSFQDVLTLDEPALFPRPALALVLIFPTSKTYETQKAREEAMHEEYIGSTDKEDV